MKILFVRSGNNGVDPISTRQGLSLKKKGVEVVYFDIVGSGLRGYLNNRKLLRGIILKENPDIVHAHYSLSGFLTVLAFTGKPVITSLMGSDVLNVSTVFLAVTRFFAKYVWKHTIVKSREIYDRISVTDSTIIPNGVDMELFIYQTKELSQKSLGWDTARIHVLFSSDPARHEKNFRLAQKAFDKVKNMLPGIEMHYLMNLTDADLVLSYNAADVLLLTSLHEGSPNVIKEAMACNCPIVATDVGDIAEVTRNTDNVSIAPFDHVKIAGAIITIINSKKRTNGRENIKQLDSLLIADKLIAAYTKVLAK